MTTTTTASALAESIRDAVAFAQLAANRPGLPSVDCRLDSVDVTPGGEVRVAGSRFAVMAAFRCLERHGCCDVTLRDDCEPCAVTAQMGEVAAS